MEAEDAVAVNGTMPHTTSVGREGGSEEQKEAEGGS